MDGQCLMSVEVEDGNGEPVSLGEEQLLLDTFRDLARWLYRALEAEWDHLNGDDEVDLAIEASEQLFTADGTPWTMPIEDTPPE